MPGPARITIELEPAEGQWVTRTHVDGDVARLGLPSVSLHVPEQREPAVSPSAYEPPTDCLCLDGMCDVDHAND